METADLIHIHVYYARKYISLHPVAVNAFGIQMRNG